STIDCRIIAALFARLPATSSNPPCYARREGKDMATSMHGAPDIHEPDDWELSDELARALETVVLARDRLQAESPQSTDYQAALTGYLQAAVHHLAILAVAQAQHSEQLSAEIAELRAHIGSLTPVMH